MKFIKVIGTLLLTLLVYSCTSETPAAAQSAINTIPPARLQEQWLLIGIDGQAITPQIESTLNISSLNKATGKLACNQFFGATALQGNTFKIDKMGSTRQICKENIMAIESIVAMVLSNDSEVLLNGDRLTLLGKEHRLNYKLK